MKSVIRGAVGFCLFALSATAFAFEVKLAPADADRRFVVARVEVRSAPAGGLIARDSTGTVLPAQFTTDAGKNVICFIVPFVAKGQAPVFSVGIGKAPGPTVSLAEKDGYLSISAGPHEITRYYFGELATKFKRPFFYPLNVGAVNVVRGYPMDPHPGETNDHPHHTGLWFGHGDVDKLDYWMNTPVKPTVSFEKFLVRESGPVLARIASVDQWGEHITETRDVAIYNAGEEVLMDWTITLKATSKPVVLGKTKEGGFSVRVATELTGPGGGKMTDALGGEGEPAIRAKTAFWADNYGVINGKTVGVALINHPTSFRAPSDWHVRAYGLFASSMFMNKDSYTLEPATPITLKYRVYAHKGDPKEGKVEQVYAGYAQDKVGE